MSGPKIFDRVKDTTTTTGTGTITLANSAATGFRTFGSVLSDADTCFYCISSSGSTEWEVGIGTYTASGTTLARTTILASSNSGSAVNFSAGTKDVYIPSPAYWFSQQNGIALTNNQVCQGRLTLTSGTPVTTTDVTGATNVYFTPFNGNQIALYTGAYWKSYTFSELTLALGTLTSGLPYDVFIYDNAGTLTLESLAWTSGTARATAIVLQDGIYVKSGATTRRYLGTFYTTATTTTEDSNAKRFLWNMYNRVTRKMLVQESTASWTYSTATWRQANAAAANQLAVVVGLAGDTISVNANGHGYNGTAVSGAEDRATGIGVNSTSSNSADITLEATNANGVSTRVQSTARLISFPAVGYTYYAWLEWARANGTTTWAGVQNSSTDQIQTGISGECLS